MSYEEQLLSNAEVSAKDLHKVLTGEKDFGSDGLRIREGAIHDYHKYLGSKAHHKGIDFTIAHAVAKDREELKRMLKQQKLLPEK